MSPETNPVNPELFDSLNKSAKIAFDVVWKPLCKKYFLLGVYKLIVAAILLCISLGLFVSSFDWNEAGKALFWLIIFIFVTTATILIGLSLNQTFNSSYCATEDLKNDLLKAFSENVIKK